MRLPSRRELLSLPALALRAAQPALIVYVGDLGPRHVIFVWGTPSAKDGFIGRSTAAGAETRIEIGGKSHSTRQGWFRVEGLQSDTRYPWRVTRGGSTVEGEIRTWPERAERLSFLVIGDYGNGSSEQLEVAAEMNRLVESRAASERPIRFVLTTGDNIYSLVPGVVKKSSGDADAHWIPKFFAPYAPLLRRIPFFPSLGNHDGNESERRGDLPVYLDNFFFPDQGPARYYSFRFGGYAEFFALDTTSNTELGRTSPAWVEGGEQDQWLRRTLDASRAPWRIAYYHHPVFTAGPRHEAGERKLASLAARLAGGRVAAAFQGHEHNFQASEVNERSRGVRYFVTGAGGELRDEDVRSKMSAANIAAWAPRRHFLLVDMEGLRMEVTPIGPGKILPVDPHGHPIVLPITVERKVQ